MENHTELVNRKVFYRSDELTGAGQMTLPGWRFTSPENYAEELGSIFTNSWLCAGRALMAPTAGCYFVRSIGNANILFVRGKDGTIRGFHNVCRHRGSRLCDEEAGTFGGAIHCPYHAWAYGLDGSLLAAAHMDAGFNKSLYPLHRIRVVESHGFVFFCVSDSVEKLEESHGALTQRCIRYGLANLISYGSITYEVAANWKLIFQNYSECYHCPGVHPALVKLSPANSGANDLTEGALLGGYMDVKPGYGSMTLSGKACGLPVGELDADDQHRVYYYALFPNTLLSLHPDYVMIHTLWPQAPGRTRIDCEWLFHPDSSHLPGFDAQDAIAFWDKTNREDWHICELNQLGVSSSAYTPGPYSTREAMSAAFDREYLRAMARR